MKIRFRLGLRICLALLGFSMMHNLLYADSGKKKIKIQDNIVINQIGFESDQEFSNWKVRKGQLERSLDHQKQGKHSLLWKWKKGDELQIDNLKGLAKAADYYAGGQPEIYEPAFYKKGLYGGIKMWVYQEQSNPGTMIFQVGHDVDAAGKNPKYRFTMNLNFTGWRAVWVQFNEDALVENYRGSDKMTSIVARPSKEAGKGAFFIDHFHLLEFVSYKRHSDLIMENNKSDFRIDTYEILTPYQKYLKSDIAAPLMSEDQKDFKTIEQRLEYLILGDETGSWKSVRPELKRVWSRILKAQIKRIKN